MIKLKYLCTYVFKKHFYEKINNFKKNFYPFIQIANNLNYSIWNYEYNFKKAQFKIRK